MMCAIGRTVPLYIYGRSRPVPGCPNKLRVFRLINTHGKERYLAWFNLTADRPNHMAGPSSFSRCHITTGNGSLPSARSTRQSPKNTRQRRLSKQYINKAFFAEYFFSGTRQRGLPSAREHSAKKSGRYGDEVTETASLPSVFPEALGKEYIFAECPLWHSAKSPPGRVPMSGSLPSALCGTRQSLPLCRVPAT
jgi:hypothetical protein